jgi:hypothetical protein
MDLTFGDLLDFVLANKTNKCFIDMSVSDIIHLLDRKIQENMVWWTTTNSKISGMIIATKDNERGILFIDENLAMNMANLQTFAKRAKQTFKGYKLMWRKHGIYKTPDTNKFYAKLSR